MDYQSKIVLHSQIALPKEYSNFLKEGNSVLVRILKQNSQNSYIASFAGGRFSIKSNQKLLVGSSFMAKVSFANGKLNLIKQNSSIQNNQKSDNVDLKNIIQQHNSLSPEVSDLLLSLGLPSDNVSKVLMQTLIFSGAKINIEKIKKARALASNFAPNEKEASEAALILMEKGIEPTIENIKTIIDLFDTNLFENNKNSFNKFNIDKNEKIKIDLQQIETEIKNYFNSVQNVKNNECGFLTIFNHLCSFGKNKTKEALTHWIIVPFDFEFNKTKPVEGSGVFRVFFDFDKKNVKKIVVNFKNYAQVWTFVVNYNVKQIADIKFCRFPDDEFSKNIQLEKKLSDMFEGVLVKSDSIENLAGFANMDVEIPLVKGMA